MTREQMLTSIQNAKKFHDAEMEKIGALVNGKSIVELTPVSKRECNFGIWIYKDEKYLRDILGAQFYESIELLHGKWHEQYYKIHAIFYTEPKKGLLSKVLKRNKISPLERDKAKLYYVELQQCTENLMKVMISSERRVVALSDSKFDKSTTSQN